MIILLGPDHSGKSTLAERLQMTDPDSIEILHHTWETDYDEYMAKLSGNKSRPIPLGTYPFQAGPLLGKGKQYILDRWFYCDLPYSEVYRKAPMQFNMKEFHNLHLATIAHNPFILLTTRQAPAYDDSVPAELHVPILVSYSEWLHSLDVKFWEYDFAAPSFTMEAIVEQGMRQQNAVIWWRNMAKRGIAGWGNTVNPKVLVLAEILGGYNVYHLPFEKGPSGFYISELIDEHSIPLSSFYITNWKKTTDPKQNMILLGEEIRRTHPDSVIILGSVAKNESAKVFDLAGFPKDRIFTIKHPGWVVNHSDSPKELLNRKKAYSREWGEMWKAALNDTRTSTNASESAPPFELTLVE